jgi:hypothetical protein
MIQMIIHLQLKLHNSDKMAVLANKQLYTKMSLVCELSNSQFTVRLKHDITPSLKAANY